MQEYRLSELVLLRKHCVCVHVCIFDHFFFVFTDILAIPWLVWKVGISLTIPVKYLSQTSPHFRCFKASLVVLWVGIWFCSGGYEVKPIFD